MCGFHGGIGHALSLSFIHVRSLFFSLCLCFSILILVRLYVFQRNNFPVNISEILRNESNKADKRISTECSEREKCKFIHDYQVVDMIDLNATQLSLLSAIKLLFTVSKEDGRR